MASLPAARIALCVAAAATLIGRPLRAQCPDGSPPPCEVRAAAQGTVRRTPPPGATERGRSFLILPFRNVTRTPEHDWLVEGSPVLVADALAQWEELRVVRAEQLYPALRRHGVAPGDVVDLDRARRIAEETAGWTVVTGEFLATGRRTRVSVRAYDAVTRREVVSASTEIEAGSDVREGYGRLARNLLAVAGLEGSAVDLPAATTQSLDAYKAYLRGVRHLNRSEYRRARDAFLEATRLDSTFAQAYARFAEASTRSIAIFLDPANPAPRYAERAVELAGTLPARDRLLVRGINSLLHGQFSSARTSLEELVAADSTNLDALEWLALLELMDWILVEVNGEERVRGSFNRAVRLGKHVLNLDPARHQAYGLLAYAYGIAGGLWGGSWVDGYRREYPSLAAQMMAAPDRRFFLMLRDTVELVPESAVAALGAQQGAAQQRARRVAREWADRWLAAGPSEAEAHVMGSRLTELDGEYGLALASLDRADSLGVETDLENQAGRRVVLLVSLGRFDAARAVADSLLAAGYFRTPVVRTQFNFRSAVWATQLYLLRGEPDKVEAVLAGYPNAPRLCGLQSGGYGYAIRVPEALRGPIADTALARMRWWAERPGLRACLAVLLVEAAGRADGEQRVRLVAAIHHAVQTFADSGDAPSALRFAHGLLDLDTTQAGRDRLFAVLERAMETASGEAHFGLGWLAARAGRRELTDRSLRHLVETGELRSAVQLAVVAINADTTTAARLGVLEQLRRIIRLDPANRSAHYQVGKIGALTGHELDVAQASLEEYLRHPPATNQPSHAAAHWRLGAIYEHRRDYNRARAAYEKSLQLDPNFNEAKAALERLRQRTP